MVKNFITNGQYALKPTKVCINCIMDDTDPLITFDSNGLCSYCLGYNERANVWIPKGEKKIAALNNMISVCKKAGKNKDYDCIIGISGGVDSTYVAYLVKQYGLRPLAVHLDNGWNSELAVSNISKILKDLNIELYTHVLNWEEFRKLQLAFLRSSTPDSEIPSDHAIVALMREIADKYKIPIIWGVNFTSEAILPKTWSQGHMDWGYIKNVNKLFGGVPLKTYPHYSIWKLIYYNRIANQKIFNILNYIDYDKEKAKAFLIDNYGWRDYGGKHYESVYTKIYQSYILPVKFGFDKRKAHYSSLILSGQMKRNEALEKLKYSSFDINTLQNDINYLVKKLGITDIEFNQIMSLKPKRYEDYSPKWQNSVKTIEGAIFNSLIKLKKLILN